MDKYNLDILFEDGIINDHRRNALHIITTVWKLYDLIHLSNPKLSKRKKSAEVGKIINMSPGAVRNLIIKGKPKFLRHD